MNVMKSKLLVTAVAMSFAATAGLALAHETATAADDSTVKSQATMSHDKMMNHDDAMMHDKAVKHDMEMKEAAAKKDVMRAGSMDGRTTGTSMAAGTGSSTDARDARMDAKDDRMEAKEEMLEQKAEMKEDKIDEMDSSQPVTDSWITTKVKTQLAATEDVRSLQITVNTVDGVVFLTGVVNDPAMAAKASAAAKTIRGVKNVDATGLKAM